MAIQQPKMIPHEAVCPVPLEFLGELYRSDEARVADLVATLTERQRGQLAAFCYNRSHLRELALKIAATCDERTLTRAAGGAGPVFFAQSRNPTIAVEFVGDRPGSVKKKISLASFAAMG